MKQLFVLVGLLGLILSSCNKPNYNTKISTENDSLSYLIGLVYGKQLKGGGEITELNIDALAKGLNEAFHKDSIKLTDEEINNQLNSIFQRLQKRLSDKNLKEGQEFLAKNKTKSGVQTLPSGLQYKVEKEGTGPMPDSSSLVTTHYTLTHINGDTIESNFKGEPAKFKVTQVIPGWTEALLKMRVGSKWQLWIPAELAYGERVRQGGPLKANEALIFTVELINVEKDNAPTPVPGN